VNRELILEPEAEAEIAEAADWYNQQKSGLGVDFVLAVATTLAAILRNPFQYQIVWKEYRRAGIARFPYGLIYRLTDRDLIVMSCFHGRRNPRVWRNRT
jgi:plasmid stabilization system protein ParE